MKIVFSALAVVVMLSALTPSAFAISDYQSGFNHGVSDARQSDTQWYILQPGKGFYFHTRDFVRGYLTGFCSVDPKASSNTDEATFDCEKGPSQSLWMVGNAAYKEGYTQGVTDGHHSIFHHGKLRGDVQEGFGQGYVSWMEIDM